MKIEDVYNYEDLEKYIKLELARQTQGNRRTVHLELDNKWFFKFANLVIFALRHDLNEKGATVPIEDECKKYILKINKIFTIVTRK